MTDKEFKDPVEDSSTLLRSSRRQFLKGMGVAAGVATVLPGRSSAEDSTVSETSDLIEFGSSPQTVTLNINGKSQRLEVEPRMTLLDAIRSKTEYTGCKEICDRGACGGCSVLVDDQCVASCMMLAIDADGSKIVTSEGIAEDPAYAPLMDAFCEHDAAQCGFCIPGILVRSAAFLKENPSPSFEEAQNGLSGNICRCGTYTKIFDAIEACGKNGGLK